METATKWIECRVHPGMFSDELAVEIGGRSFFVDMKTVRKVRDGHGEIKVKIVETECRKWAVIPTSTRETVPLPV